jgi:hypothetical protein
MGDCEEERDACIGHTDPTCAMGNVVIDPRSAPGCERLPDAGKQGGPRAA